MKKVLHAIASLFGFGAPTKKTETQFPPVPKWRPDFSITIEQALERMVYYTDGKDDIAVFKNGTLVKLPAELSYEDATKYALNVLSEIFNYHPDMNPTPMDDGNIVIQYNHPAYNVVISEFADQYIEDIKANHIDGLATSEVLITPLGSNVFDEFGIKALYGRAFMFMDAQEPEVVKIFRCDTAE